MALPDGSCLKNKAQELLDAGISIVVIKDNIPDELPAGITAVPCVGISADNMSSAASSYASDGICFAFTIGFEGSDDQFSYDSLDSAVDTGNAISESYGAGIADFTRMKELTDKRNALVSEAINKNIEKRDELIRRREELGHRKQLFLRWPFFAIIMYIAILCAVILLYYLVN